MRHVPLFWRKRDAHFFESSQPTIRRFAADEPMACNRRTDGSLLCLRCFSCEPLYGFEALLAIDRLRQEVVAASLYGELPVAVEGIGGEGHYGQVGVFRLNGLGGFETVHDGHLDVHEHDVDTSGVDHFYGLAAVVCPSVLIMATEDVSHENEIALVVFGYKNCFHIEQVFNSLTKYKSNAFISNCLALIEIFN